MQDEQLVDGDDDFFVLVVSQRSELELEMLLGAEFLASGQDAFTVGTAAHAQVFVERAAISGVIIDLDLPDMDAYDLCGWIRARFRDLPVLIMGAPEGVDTAAVHLSPGGGTWTISESLREQMTDSSVLHGVLDSVAVPDTEEIAQQTGQTVEEAEEALREVLRKSGCKTHEELRYHVRNLPHDYHLREGVEKVVRFVPGPIASS